MSTGTLSPLGSATRKLLQRCEKEIRHARGMTIQDKVEGRLTAALMYLNEALEESPDREPGEKAE